MTEPKHRPLDDILDDLVHVTDMIADAVNGDGDLGNLCERQEDLIREMNMHPDI